MRGPAPRRSRRPSLTSTSMRTIAWALSAWAAATARPVTSSHASPLLNARAASTAPSTPIRRPSSTASPTTQGRRETQSPLATSTQLCCLHHRTHRRSRAPRHAICPCACRLLDWARGRRSRCPRPVHSPAPHHRARRRGRGASNAVRPLEHRLLEAARGRRGRCPRPVRSPASGRRGRRGLSIHSFALVRPLEHRALDGAGGRRGRCPRPVRSPGPHQRPGLRGRAPRRAGLPRGAGPRHRGGGGCGRCRTSTSPAAGPRAGLRS